MTRRGRPAVDPAKVEEALRLRAAGVGVTAIADQLGIGRTTVYRILDQAGGGP